MSNAQYKHLTKIPFSATFLLKEVNMTYIVRVGVSRSPLPFATFAEAWTLLREEIVKLLQVGGVNSAIMEHLCWIQVNGTEIIWFDDAQNIAHILGLIGEGEGFAFQSVVSLNEAMDLEPRAQELIEEWFVRQAAAREVLEEIERMRQVVIRMPVTRSMSDEEVRARTKQFARLRQEVARMRVEYELGKLL